MAKKPKVTEPGEIDADSTPSAPKFKVSTVVPKTIINGHVLTVGTVVEMTEEDIDKHRSGGVCLLPVGEDDNREVYDISQPYVADGNGE